MNFKTFWAKNGANIAFYGGLAGMVGTSVLVGRAASKYKDTVAEYNKQINDIKMTKETIIFSTEEEKAYKKDLTKAYIRKSLQILKLYYPAIILGSISGFGLVWSHNKNVSTITTLTTAYSALKAGFDKYRERVANKVGVKEEENLYFDAKEELIENPETGKKEKRTVLKDAHEYDFTRFFDQSSRFWDKDPDLRNLFLSGAEKELTARLKSGGYGNFLSINEVYDYLDIPKTKMGQLVGWFYYPDNPLYSNYISFNLDDVTNEKVRDFKNGYESAILLRFNYDGFLSEQYKEAADKIIESEGKNNE